MRIIICANEQELDIKAAEDLANHIKRNPDTVLGLATGGTPVGMYEQLIDMHKNDELDFSRTISFNLDEYVGIPYDHPCSYHAYMDENLFDHVNMSRENINIPDGLSESLDEACTEYEEKIKSVGGIDVQILGIGHNAHIGFNEPGTPFHSVTSIVELTPSTREANSRFFDSIDEVPTHAVSMGIKTIMQAKKIILLAKGADKADAILKALYGPITPDVPASVLQLHPNVTVFVDKEAGSKFPTKD